MKNYKVGILGATGAVGLEMIKVIEERKLPLELTLFASKNSAGKTLPFRGEELVIHEATKDCFAGLDFVLGAVEAAQSREFAPYIMSAGACFIDNSSAFRMDPEVPLVVPEINGADAHLHKGIISNPNCSTIIAVMAISGIARLARIESAVASTYQAVSGAGINGLKELEAQNRELTAGGDPSELERKVFPAQIAGNVIPFIGKLTDNGYTDEEMKMQNESSKILHLPELKLNCTCVRVPVMRSHSVSITLRLDRKITLAEAAAAIDATPGVHMACDLDGRDYPTPLDTSDQDDVYVGRLRYDLSCENGISLWCCGDQIRKGAATNAVQIMEELM